MTIDPEAITFLKSERLGVLAVAMPDGSVHAATLHLSVHEAPLKLFFATSKSTKKVGAFANSESVKASVVVGANLKDWQTLQLDGDLRMITDDEVETLAKAVHYANHPDTRAKLSEPDAVMFEFVPTWWRYSNFNQQPPLFQGSSEADYEVEDWDNFFFHHE